MTTVLVVDDDAANRSLVAEALRDDGYEVETARDGREALRKALRHPPSLLVTDLRMPRMGGDELIAWCRQHDPLRRLPVVLMSASYESLARFQAMGADVCLAKPFDLDDLSRVVGQLAA